jgi:hypothetical protein
MGLKSFYSFIILFGFLLSSCRLSDPALLELNDAHKTQPEGISTATTTARVTSRVITENGSPVGIRLDDERVLRFSPPGAKLYTDPLAFDRAVQEGLNGFLISLDQPLWLQRCELIPEKTFMQCDLQNRPVYLQERQVSEYTVWLSVPVDHVSAESELEETGFTLRLEASPPTSSAN